MQNKKFNQLKDKGNRGENFFVQRHNELIAHPVMLIQDMTDWGVEGSDLTGERLMWKKALVKDLEGIDRDGISPYFEYGGIEVKTLSHDQFLPRFGVDDLPCGTLGFPLWEKTEDLSEDRTGYLRGAHGNLRRWMEPSVDNRSSKPMLLVHLLYTEDIDVESNKANERPFAAIIFEDVEALLGRIIDHLLPYDLNLKDWNSIPVDQKAKELQIPGLYLQGNNQIFSLLYLSSLLPPIIIFHCKYYILVDPIFTWFNFITH